MYKILEFVRVCMVVMVGLLTGWGWFAVSGSGAALGQAVDGDVSADDPPPPLTYHGLIPGRSLAEQVRKVLGPPQFEASWYSYKMLYRATRPKLFDALHLHGRKGKLGAVEAASIPEGYETAAAIRRKLGEPEYELRMATFSLLDYSAKGVRFTLDRGGRTNGVAYFPHLRPRVHSGARKLVDLTHLREGPQPRPSNPASLDGLKAGTDQRKITPLEPEWLDPRYRPSYRPHDDLWARTLVFEKDELTVALVGADLFGMSLSEIEPMIERLRQAGVEHFVLAMSHDHAAPDTIGVYGHFPAEYIAYLQEQIVGGVLAARQSLKPVKELRCASRELPMDGARVSDLIRNARNPGLLDPTISILQAIGNDDKPIATLVHFACHVEGIEAGVKELTADFPGYMCDRIRRDGGGQPVFFNGAVGGMVTGDTKARTHEEAKTMGLSLAAIVEQLARRASPSGKFAFSVDTRRIEIPLSNERFKPLFEPDARRPLYRGRVVSEMSLVTIGECQMLTIPGELLPEVGFEILEKMSGFPRMIVGLANDELGYIIPTWDFRADVYEESMSLGPAAAPVVRDTALRMLTGVK